MSVHIHVPEPEFAGPCPEPKVQLERTCVRSIVRTAPNVFCSQPISIAQNTPNETDWLIALNWWTLPILPPKCPFQLNARRHSRCLHNCGTFKSANSRIRSSKVKTWFPSIILPVDECLRLMVSGNLINVHCGRQEMEQFLLCAMQYINWPAVRSQRIGIEHNPGRVQL